MSVKGQVGARKRFCPKGQWAWNRLLRAVGMAPSCGSSRNTGTLLSDIGFEFGCCCVETAKFRYSVILLYTSMF